MLIVRAIDALATAQRVRKLKPAGDLNRIQVLFLPKKIQTFRPRQSGLLGSGSSMRALLNSQTS